MDGRPLDHAREISGALIGGLDERDSLEMLAFSSEAFRWRRKAVRATPAERAAALRWLAGLQAGGGTEMRAGIEAALRPLGRDSQRQVVVMTDGHIGFESEIVREVRDRLPRGSRLHAVGVGSSVNRALTGPAARAGRGIEIVVDLDEEVSRAAQRLCAATHAPVVVDLELEGEAIAGRAPRALPDLFAARPLLVSLALRPEGGEIRVRGRTRAGAWEALLRAPACAPGEGSAALVARYGRESVGDLEADLAAGGDAEAIDRAVERIGLDFQIATRRTSWVAVSEERSVDPRAPIRRVRMPQALPYGVSAEGMGLRAPVMGLLVGRFDALADGSAEAFPPARSASPAPRSARGRSRGRGLGWAGVLGSSFGRSPRILRGRRVAEATFEAEVAEGALAWSPPARATLELADGRHVEVDVVAERSTRKGRIEIGSSLRVTLALPAAELGAAVAAVELGELRIEL
jgi:Ca-activated chloride channel family protein